MANKKHVRSPVVGQRKRCIAAARPVSCLTKVTCRCTFGVDDGFMIHQMIVTMIMMSNMLIMMIVMIINCDYHDMILIIHIVMMMMMMMILDAHGLTMFDTLTFIFQHQMGQMGCRP